MSQLHGKHVIKCEARIDVIVGKLGIAQATGEESEGGIPEIGGRTGGGVAGKELEGKHSLSTLRFVCQGVSMAAVKAA